jgi:hypothetical protein
MKSSDFDEELPVLCSRDSKNILTKKKMVFIILFVTTVILTASVAILLSLSKNKTIISVHQIVASLLTKNEYSAPAYAHAVSPYANLIRLKSYTPADDNNRIFVMGDAHGCLAKMNLLLEKVQFQPSNDTLIMAGDLIYRGHNSIGVLERARELGAFCVRGNHDDKVIRFKSFEQQHGIAAMMIDLEALMPEGQVGDPLKFKSKHATLAR